MSVESVTIVGGGVAGLTAGCALADAGYRVRLLERRPYVGGRASSYQHPGAGEVIDNCQHIVLGCCTSLVALYQRIGAADDVQWFSDFTFLEPGGRRSPLSPSPLPAPLHTTPSFLASRCFSVADKLAIARGIRYFLLHTPPDQGENFAQWLVRFKQTPAAVERFWKPVLASALNESPELISMRYAAKVFREVFLFSPQGGRMGVPRVPLSVLYGKAADYIAARGGEVLLRTGVDAIQASGSQWLLRSGAESFSSDAVVLALPFEALQRLLPAMPAAPGAERLAADLAQFRHSPITSVHLWFDRVVTDLDHAVLLDRTIEWLYNKSRLQPAYRTHPGSYLELVVSASKSLVPMERQQIIDTAMRELAEFLPEVNNAVLLKAAVTKEVRATYSIFPGLDALRPTAESPWRGIFLAGDWTATGWPSTMEGAARSGFLAAEAVARLQGSPHKFLPPDLPPTGLMRLFA